MKLLIAIFVSCATLLAQGWQYTVGDNGFTALTYNSASFLAADSRPLLFGVGWDGEAQEEVTSCTRSSGATYFQYECNPETNKHFRLRIDVAGAGTDTLELTIALTNLSSPARAITQFNAWQATAVAIPAGATHWPDPAGWNTLHGRFERPASLTSWTGGRIAVYTTSFYGLGHGWFASGDRISLEVLTVEGGTPYSLPSGSTTTNTIYLRHGTDEPIEILAAPAYAAWNAAHPQQLMWDDRRLFCATWIAEKTRQSAINPRGYAWDENLDVSDAAALKAALLNSLTNTIQNCKLHYGQGLFIWDLEGQEFPHPMTYVGSGGLHYQTGQSWMGAGGAPEIEAIVDGEPIVDSLFRAIRNNGLMVGLTLRPSVQTFGTGGPTGVCHGQGLYAGEAYIDTAGTPISPGRGYGCYENPVTFDDANNIVQCGDNCNATQNGQSVRFYTISGTLPAGLTQFTEYFVCNWDADNLRYQVGTTAGCGTVVTDFSGASGTSYHELWQGPTSGLAHHREAWNYQDALDTLRAKTVYANRRWGVRLFYVDTSGYVIRGSGDGVVCGPSIPDCRGYQYITKELWQQLNEEFPDFLFMPENSNADSYTASFYTTVTGWWTRTQERRNLYRDHFVMPHINSPYLDYLADNRPALVRKEMLAGVTYLASVFTPPTGETNINTYLVADYELARTEAGSLTLTNTATSRARTFTGTPRTAHRFPLVMRVAFRGDGSFDGSENTYCERRDTVQCFQGGARVTDGQLNLTGLTHFRLEYRTFTGLLLTVGYQGGL